MAAIDPATLDRWRTLQIVDRDGGTVGSISEFYLDRETRYPTWALVNVGLFGARQIFVPLLEATEIRDGLQVPYEKSHIKDAPRIDLHGELTPQEEAILFAHYGVEYQPVGEEEAGVEDEVEAAEGGAAGVEAGEGAGAAELGTTREGGTVEETGTRDTGAEEAGAAEAAEPGAAGVPEPNEDGARAAEEEPPTQDERAAAGWRRAGGGNPGQTPATDDLAWPASPPPPGPITEPPGEPPEVPRAADRDR
jgi:PRC-barrel domain